MAFIERSVQGYITGTTGNPTTMLQGSGSSRYVIKSLSIKNRDVNDGWLNISKYVTTGTPYMIWESAFASGDHLLSDDGDVWVLDDNTQFIKAYFTSGTFTKYPSFVINYGDVS